MSSSKKAKGGKQKAGKKGSKEPKLVEHPRARRSINMAKSYAGLGAFLFAGYSSWHAGSQFVDVATRALLWGMAAYLLVWALGVQVWRHLIIAEVRAAERRWRERSQPNPDQVAKLTQILEENGMPTGGTGAPRA